MLKDEVQAMKGDEVPLIPMKPQDPPYGGAHRCHPLDPLPTRPYGSPRKSGRCTPRCRPASQPWSQVKVSASHMQACTWRCLARPRPKPRFR